jgi:hypothetical protein
MNGDGDDNHRRLLLSAYARRRVGRLGKTGGLPGELIGGPLKVPCRSATDAEAEHYMRTAREATSAAREANFAV